jgi:hypothetical protein
MFRPCDDQGQSRNEAVKGQGSLKEDSIRRKWRLEDEVTACVLSGNSRVMVRNRQRDAHRSNPNGNKMSKRGRFHIITYYRLTPRRAGGFPDFD